MTMYAATEHNRAYKMLPLAFPVHILFAILVEKSKELNAKTVSQALNENMTWWTGGRCIVKCICSHFKGPVCKI